MTTMHTAATYDGDMAAVLSNQAEFTSGQPLHGSDPKEAPRTTEDKRTAQKPEWVSSCGQPEASSSPEDGMGGGYRGEAVAEDPGGVPATIHPKK